MPSLEEEVIDNDSSSDSDDSDDDEHDEKAKTKKPTKNMSEKVKVEDHFYDMK